MSVVSVGSTGCVSVASSTPSPSQSVTLAQLIPSAVPSASRSSCDPSASSESRTPSLSSSSSTASHNESASLSYRGTLVASRGLEVVSQFVVSSASEYPSLSSSLSRSVPSVVVVGPTAPRVPMLAGITRLSIHAMDSPNELDVPPWNWNVTVCVPAVSTCSWDPLTGNGFELYRPE